MKKFLLICGISGSGKSYIEEKLTEKLFKGRIRFKKMKQVTTRSMREDESQGKPYIFLSGEDEFKKYEDELIAKTHFHGDYYGTLDESDTRFNLGFGLTINTIIVNRMGYDNVVNDLRKKYGNNFDIKVLRILNTKPVERDGRTSESLKLEQDNLEDIANIDVINEEGNWADLDNIVAKLYESGFIYEIK